MRIPSRQSSPRSAVATAAGKVFEMKPWRLNWVLHAHMPFVSHPEDPGHFEQRWLYEAVAESYLPLIAALRRLSRGRSRLHLTISLSPTLCMMLADRGHAENCERYIRNQIGLAEFEVSRHRKSPTLEGLASYYLGRYREVLDLYVRDLDRNLLGAFTDLRRRGVVSLITSAATHAFLPLLEDYPGALRAQVRGGLELYRRLTGEAAVGFWLPECGYSPKIESVLGAAGAAFTIVDAHGIAFAKPSPPDSVYQPVVGPHGVTLYGRDASTSELVWSAESGYPAHPSYRDFYEDIVHDLPLSRVKRHVHPGGLRIPSGIKYKRISGQEQKELYDPRKAARTAAAHAGEFVLRVIATAARVREITGRAPLMTLAFDMELFGHWWHEGCIWLEKTLRAISRREDVRMVSGEALQGEPLPLARVVPESSSWGYRGYSETWINPRNDWMIRPLHEATEAVLRIVSRHSHAREERKVRALNMLARELLLLQSSDWNFLIDRGISVSYVERRFFGHIGALKAISEMIVGDCLRESYLNRLASEQAAFPEADFRWLLAD